MPQSRLAAVGLFVIGGILLFAVGLFLIGDRRMLFNDTFRFYAEFKQLAALDAGAKVRVSGVDAGEVEEIAFPTGPSGRFNHAAALYTAHTTTVAMRTPCTAAFNGSHRPTFSMSETG